MSRRKMAVITVTACVVFLLGLGGMRVLMQLRTPPPRQDVAQRGKLVRVITAQIQEVPLTVTGFGTVRATAEWRAVPEVAGAVVRVSPQLHAGLHLSRGELLFEIDPRMYRLAVQRIRAEILKAEKDIAVLQQQQRNYDATLQIAQRNLAIADDQLQRDEALVRKGTISTRERDNRRQLRNEMEQAVQAGRNSLALTGPQIAKAEATIAVARAQLAEARLQLSKTRIVAPFDGQVVTSSLDVGEFVQAGQEVATLYDTTAVEIPLAIAPDELRWFPTAGTDLTQLTATVRWHSGAQPVTWQGRVARWESGLDAATRMMTLVVEVPHPWNTRTTQFALQPGMFCEVEMVVRRVSHAVVIPRVALRDQHTIFLAQDGVLAVRPVHVLRVHKGYAILTDGVQAGERVVISPLTTPIVGMKLRTVEQPAMAPSTVPAPEGRATLRGGDDSHAGKER